MAFFEPEEARALRFRRACENKTIDQLRAIVDGEQPELLKKAAGEELEAKESLAHWKEQKRREEEERRGERKKMFAKLLGKDEDDDKPTKNRPPEF